MKKNFFITTIAILVSTAILGTSSILTASAKGVQVGTVEVAPGTTTVNVPVNMVDVVSQGVELTFSADGTVITGIECPGALAYEGTAAGGVTAVYASGMAYKTDKPFETLEVTLAADAEPGKYPIYVSITILDDNGSPAKDPEGISGAIVINTDIENTGSIAAETANTGAITETIKESTAQAVTKNTTEADNNAKSVITKKTSKKNDSSASGSKGIIVTCITVITLTAAGIVLFIIKKRKTK